MTSEDPTGIVFMIFFETLLIDFQEAYDASPGSDVLNVMHLAQWVLRHCHLSKVLHGTNDADRASEIAEWIAEEIAVISAYTTAWRGSATIERPGEGMVAAEVSTEAARRVVAWPEIAKDPVPQSSHGRIVKSHPLTFPAGCGDIKQPRVRSDFSPFEWTRHVFRFFDGRVVSSLRGQRAVWACFNAAMQEKAREKGNLLHKHSKFSAMSKAELKQYVEDKQNLVSQLSLFGSELPSTSMQWKREGQELQWIVRQMSWVPPWTVVGHENAASDVRRLSSYIEPKDAGSPAKIKARLAHDASMHCAPVGVDCALEGCSDVAVGANAGGQCDANHAFAHSDAESDVVSLVQNVVDGALREEMVNSEEEWHCEDVHAHPWHCLPNVKAKDHYGYGRNPAFWFILNYPYNDAFDAHRFF